MYNILNKNGEVFVPAFKGDVGETPDIQIGTVTTLEPEEPATVTRTGTDEEPIFNFGIPRGNDGGYSGINRLKDPNKTYLVIKTPADNNIFTLSTGAGGSPDYTIEWGDGTSEAVTTTSNPSHEYATAGMYLIIISGYFPNGIWYGISANENKDKIIEVYGGSNYPLLISGNAFRECTSLTTANFTQVTTIGGIAFRECTSLTTVNFPNATSIEADAFILCSSLTTANIPNATSIESYTFSSCSSLTTVNFPNATSIEGFAFNNCISLTTADFPNVTSIIGDYAFNNCSSLKELTLGNVITTDSGTRFTDVKLINLKIAQDVTNTDIDRIKQFYADNGGTFTGAQINSI